MKTKQALLLLFFNLVCIVGFGQKNIIFILTDDQGFNQLGCYGSTYYETPNLDKIAAKGMRFNQGYAACPVCSPTRSSILSGKYPARLHVTDWLNGYTATESQILDMPAWKMYLDGREVTIAEKLKEYGYTTGFWGKWHIGANASAAENQGFDNAIEYLNPSINDFDSDCLIGDAFKDECWDDAHSTIRIADRAVEFLEANKTKPMFLYVSYNGVHTPIIERDSLIQKYKNKEGSNLEKNNPTLAAMTQTVDQSVGIIYNKVAQLGLLDSTIFIYFADNGCRTADAPVPPLRGGKTQLFEGGIREPMIVSWQNTIAANSVCDDYIISTDFYTTILDLVNIDYDTTNYPDSKSFIKSIRQETVNNERPIYWHYPHYHPENYEGPQGAIRKGDYKLIIYYEEYFTEKGNPFELYNLKEDIGESTNLATTMPEKVKELNQLFLDWKVEVMAQDPTVKGSLDLPNGTYYIKAAHSNKVLAVKDGAITQSANVVQETLNDDDASQQWILRKLNNSFYTIDNNKSNYLMSVDAWKQEPEANVSVWGTYANQANQSCRQWKFVETENGYYQIIAHHAGLYLEVADSSIEDGANIQINDPNRNAMNLEFELIPIETEKPFDNGLYYIESVQNDKVIAVENGSIEQSANIIEEDKTAETSQQWTFRLQDNGFYTIDNKKSNYLMCVAGWGTTPASNVVVWGTEEGHAQQTCRQWQFLKTENGNYNIMGKHSGLYLEVAANGNVQINALDTENLNMTFKITEVSSASISETTIPQAHITLSPNPVKDVINIKFLIPQTGNLKLYDNKGEEVLSKHFTHTKHYSMDMSNEACGNYYLKVTISELSKSFKIIKK